MPAMNRVLALAFIQLTGCFQAVKQKWGSTSHFAMDSKIEQLNTMPVAKIGTWKQLNAGIDVALSYDLHCAPGMAVVWGDLKTARVAGMPLSTKQAIGVTKKSVGPFEAAKIKSKFNAKEKKPVYVLLPTQSAVVFDPSKLNSNAPTMGATAEFQKCGSFEKKEFTPTVNGLGFRVLLQEKGEKLEELNKGALKLSSESKPNSYFMGKIEFRAAKNETDIQPHYFHFNAEDLSNGRFNQEIFDRLKHENAIAKVSAAAFGMRWNVTQVSVATPWTTCKKLGIPNKESTWTQNELADAMNSKSAKRQIKSPIDLTCKTAERLVMSTINHREFSKEVGKMIQSQHESKSCIETTFLAEYTSRPTLEQWIAYNNICGMDAVKKALKQVKRTPTDLLSAAIANGDLKSAAAAMRTLRPYVEYKTIPSLSRAMVKQAIATANKTPQKSFKNLAYGFRGVAFGKRSIPSKDRQKMLRDLGVALDTAILKNLDINIDSALKAHADFGGVMGKKWTAASQESIQGALRSSLMKQDKKAARQAIESCGKKHPKICTEEWTKEILSKL